MVKCEVLENCVISIQKGSIVNVSDEQFELARTKLKRVDIPVIEPIAKEEPKKTKKK